MDGNGNGADDRPFDPLDTLGAVTGSAELLALQSSAGGPKWTRRSAKDIVALVRATRKDEPVKLGASPRTSLSLLRAAQAFAAVRGRTHILPYNVKLLAVPALAHRVMVKTEARLRERKRDSPFGLSRSERSEPSRTARQGRQLAQQDARIPPLRFRKPRTARRDPAQVAKFSRLSGEFGGKSGARRADPVLHVSLKAYREL